MPRPVIKVPITMIMRGPYRSTRKPSIGETMLPSSRSRANAPDMRARLQPKYMDMGVKKTCLA